MSDDNKFWLGVVTVCCITILLIIVLGIVGCHEVEQTTRTAMQNGYYQDRGEWHKHP